MKKVEGRTAEIAAELENKKELKILLKVFSELPEKTKDVFLSVLRGWIGDGCPGGEELEKRARAAGLTFAERSGCVQ